MDDLPDMMPNYTNTAPANRKGLAIASLIMGILSLCGWLLPICGIPLAIVGLVLGILGLKSNSRGLAIAGIIMAGLSLVLGIGNAILGAVIGLSNPTFFQDIINSI